jgi:hypothetical protein
MEPALARGARVPHDERAVASLSGELRLLGGGQKVGDVTVHRSVEQLFVCADLQ